MNDWRAIEQKYYMKAGRRTDIGGRGVRGSRRARALKSIEKPVRVWAVRKDGT